MDKQPSNLYRRDVYGSKRKKKKRCHTKYSRVVRIDAIVLFSILVWIVLIGVLDFVWVIGIE